MNCFKVIGKIIASCLLLLSIAMELPFIKFYYNKINVIQLISYAFVYIKNWTSVKLFSVIVAQNM